MKESRIKATRVRSIFVCAVALRRGPQSRTSKHKIRRTKLFSPLWLLTLLFLPAFAAPQQSSVENRIDALISRMTLEEKLGELQILDGEANVTYRREHIGLVRRGLLGSTLNVRGARKTNELQRIAVEESRLKIPLIFGFDVIHGYRTIFPVPLAEAS